MSLIQDILKYKSLSIVGLEKNTGKTECLNYILQRIPLNSLKIAVSSSGVDGETTDIVTNTSKPEIYLRKGIYFATSEKFFNERKIVSEIFDIDYNLTATGRIVTSRAVTDGKALLAGHSATQTLKDWMERLRINYGIDHFIIDGALSRLTPASPAVCESMILNTGASLSVNLKSLVSKSSFVVDLINLPLCTGLDFNYIDSLGRGIFSIDKNGKADILSIESSFTVDKNFKELINITKRLYFGGAVTDKIFNILNSSTKEIDLEVIVKDFTKIFISKENFTHFTRRGGKLTVLKRSKLIAVCVNPYSPSGFTLDSDLVCDELRRVIDIPVYDIKKNGYEA